VYTSAKIPALKPLWELSRKPPFLRLISDAVQNHPVSQERLSQNRILKSLFHILTPVLSFETKAQMHHALYENKNNTI
jgi:hypothetical protein